MWSGFGGRVDFAAVFVAGFFFSVAAGVSSFFVAAFVVDFDFFVAVFFAGVALVPDVVVAAVDVFVSAGVIGGAPVDVDVVVVWVEAGAGAGVAAAFFVDFF